MVDAVLVGVKPQILDEVAPSISVLAGPETLILSILAGVELDSLAARFPRSKGHVRISLCQPEDILREAAERLRRFVSTHRSKAA